MTSRGQAQNGFNKECGKLIQSVLPRAEQGDAEAQWVLGTCYRGRRLTAEDVAQSVSWFRKSAENGFADGQVTMGHLYCTGAEVGTNAPRITWRARCEDQYLIFTNTAGRESPISDGLLESLLVAYN